MSAQLAPNSSPMRGSDWIAPDVHGANFFTLDESLQSLLPQYLPPDLLGHMSPHLHRLGEIAGTELDELARTAERHPPVLHPRDALGRDREWIEYHPAYREMERLAYGEFGIHCMSRRPGVFGWPDAVPPVAKYLFQYLFVQAEFGLMCPVSLTDTSAMLVERYASEEVKNRYLPGMVSQDMTALLKSAQFMTEKSAGSDVGNLELTAKYDASAPGGGAWRLYGDKWFCSAADADVAVLLARPEGAPVGTRGVGLFVMPRVLEDGQRNDYRIVRLKDKMGTRSMASGEIIFEGAIAYPLGEVGPHENTGLKMMMDQVNMSRLSHGVRAAGMMRRCLNEALVVAKSRRAFGGPIVDKPLLRRQLMKIAIPTEQSLSMMMFTACQLGAADGGDPDAARLVRILTPLFKFRACRDNIGVATGAMEVRGGNGFIEDWVNSRFVRDAHIGVLWEGTSNINALDVTTRAIAKVQAHEVLADTLHGQLNNASALPGQYRGELAATVDRAVRFAAEVAAAGRETLAREAADALYHVTTAVLMAVEGAVSGANGGDASRLVMSRMVLEHRLKPNDPLAMSDDDDPAASALLSDEPVSLASACALACP